MGVFWFKFKRRYEEVIEKIDLFFKDFNESIKRFFAHPRTEQTVANVKKAGRKVASHASSYISRWRERIDTGESFKLHGEDQ